MIMRRCRLGTARPRSPQRMPTLHLVPPCIITRMAGRMRGWETFPIESASGFLGGEGFLVMICMESDDILVLVRRPPPKLTRGEYHCGFAL